MKPGLDTIRGICAALGDPQRKLRNVIHVAGTNGKGAVCAILDAALGNNRIVESSNRLIKVARYTSPHLVRINERFFLNGAPIADEILERASSKVDSAIRRLDDSKISSVTFFEALTAVAFVAYAEADPDWTILETGLGGRLDATNICEPKLTIITKIGLDHCDWLGDTVEKIAAEKAGIIKPGVPIVLARNEPSVIEVVRKTAAEKGAPFFYAPDLASDSDIPSDFSLAGSFNRENCITALAALQVLQKSSHHNFSFFTFHFSLSNVVWPGRFQRIGQFIVDGAHNPPAARALAEALARQLGSVTDAQLDSSTVTGKLKLICGFCGDKDALQVLQILKPFVSEGYAVRTNNPRSLSPEATAELMRKAGIPATPCESLAKALQIVKPSFLTTHSSLLTSAPKALICGSLFLAGEAIVELDAYPWGDVRFDASELLKAQ